MNHRTGDLIGIQHRVRILTWFDHVALVVRHRPGVDVLGTIVRVQEYAGNISVSVCVDGVDGTFVFRPSDVEMVGPCAGSSVEASSQALDPTSGTTQTRGTEGRRGDAAGCQSQRQNSTR